MSTQEIGALIQSVNDMTSTVAGKMTHIDERMTEAESEFDAWRNLKDVIGAPDGQGTMRMNIFQGIIIGAGGEYPVAGSGDFTGKIDALGSSSNVYVHFKTPMNINTSDEMFWFNIRGYCYGASAVIDETIVGYAYYPQRNIINKASFGGVLPDSYKDTAGNVILRIKLPVAYYTTLRIDTMRVGTSTLFEVGCLDVKVSLTETVDF